jgi:hypothetical protein
MKMRKPSEEVEITLALPYYSKGLYSHYIVTESEECMVVFTGRGMEFISWTSLENILADGNVQSTKEEFETAFESVLTIIKNRIYAR